MFFDVMPNILWKCQFIRMGACVSLFFIHRVKIQTVTSLQVSVGRLCTQYGFVYYVYKHTFSPQFLSSVLHYEALVTLLKFTVVHHQNDIQKFTGSSVIMICLASTR